jgi:hypothetical protein
MDPGSRMLTNKERFWSKVNKTDDCWLWMGAKDIGGYGRFNLEKKLGWTHRISLEWSLGRPIGEGLVARHKCRNRHCVNPEHLEEGTYAENQQDRIRDGTSNNGTKSSSCKLTEEQVWAIRVDLRSQREIAADYGICQMTISRIKSGKTWGCLK